ncbi:hypothetical protein AQ490_10870 [Wenjunlia vitaminophila]|uniref:Secreted protein n=1 Tax=Wenjunlia vitaminophila TaxID=76728 RepID=A0A0T6LK26_WENVI|nr:hypothetical protein [Wenjunlia vitaminophila]KRV46410.1 hypothetical protein AQ490_10870 [Wenjunlia vitaminophila]
MDIVLAVVALFFVMTTALAAVAVVKTKRAVQRGLERHVPQARRMIEDTTLKARRVAQPGVSGQIADVRLAMRASLDSTRRTLRAACAEDVSLGESLALCDRLDAHARALEEELKVLEREPDKARVSVRLPELRERAERIAHSADTLRWAAQDRARRFADEELVELSRICEGEAAALRHWTGPEPAVDEPQESAPGSLGAGDPPKAFPGSPSPAES